MRNHSLHIHRATHLLLGCILSAGLSACHSADKDRDYGDPTRLDVATERSGIWTQFIAPQDTLITDAPHTDVTLRAWIEDEPTQLTVMGGHALLPPEPAEVEGAAGKDQKFHFSVDLLHGRNEVHAAVRAPQQDLRRTTNYIVNYQGDAPGLLVTHVRAKAEDEDCPPAPPALSQEATNAPHACVYGQVSTAADRSLRALEVRTDTDTSAADAPAPGRFVLEVPLQENTLNTLTVRAEDEEGDATERSIDIIQNQEAPTLEITSPDSDTVHLQEEQLNVRGTAEGTSPLQELRFYLGDDLLLREDASEEFDVSLPIPVGEHTLRVELHDIAGNHSDAAINVTRARINTLHATEWSGGEALLQLDKDALAELLDESAQKSLTLAEIKLRPFLYGAIDAIRNPLDYGTDPDDLGQAEFNFYRLLNLSADSADLSGTSLENLGDLAYAIGLPTARILAELLDMGLDEPALDTDLIVDVMLTNLILTHPNADSDAAGDPILKIRLYDALRNLEPLAERYGPDEATGHPGIIGGAITAEVLEPGFLMSARAISHLIAFEGINASKGSKDLIYVLDGDQVLSLDVDDDETFSIVGLVDEPVVDVRIALFEDPDFIEVGDDRTARPDPDHPGAYKGNSSGWDLDPWILERVVLEITYMRYVDAYEDNDYQHTLRYDAGAIENAAVFEWERGWFETSTAGGLGTPPAPQYVWDTLLELAQVRLHDGLEEGEANVRFDLQNVPVGVTSDDLVDAIRPELADQEEQLSDMLLGDSGVAQSQADFYFVETLSDKKALFYYRDAADSSDGPTFARPGFFHDVELSEPADTTDAIGSDTDDTTHRKLSAAAGEHYYFVDKNDDVYRLDVIDVRDDAVDVLITQEETP